VYMTVAPALTVAPPSDLVMIMSGWTATSNGVSLLAVIVPSVPSCAVVVIV